MNVFIGITLIVLLIVLVARSLARLHVDVNNLLAGTHHLIDRPPAWRTGKPDRAHRHRNARKTTSRK